MLWAGRGGGNETAGLFVCVLSKELNRNESCGPSRLIRYANEQFRGLALRMGPHPVPLCATFFLGIVSVSIMWDASQPPTQPP